MQTENTSVEKIFVMDTFSAKVVGKSTFGIILQLENGCRAFAYNFTSIHPGSEVLCSVRRMPAPGRELLVAIDSVTYYAESNAA